MPRASSAGSAELPADVSIDDGLTETEAIAIALWNNSGFQESLADLGIARADLVQAGLLRNPVLLCCSHGAQSSSKRRRGGRSTRCGSGRIAWRRRVSTSRRSASASSRAD